jgi:anti-sigma regulatory factor (Ser/Thr protein kinase)
VTSDLVALPADGRAAGLARRFVRTQLLEWDLDDLLDTAVLLTSEVVTNVIVHTASSPSLRLTRDGERIRVTVVDGSPVPPRRRWHTATATTGRGLQMLQDLADDWGWNPSGDGKAVWFTLRRNRDAAPVGGARPQSPAAASALLPAPAPALTPPPTPAPSPLGRYSAAPGAGSLVPVRLLGVPVRVLAASREQHDSLMREFRLLALAGGPGRPDVPTRLVDLTQTLGVRFAAARARPDDDFERAVEQGLDTVDLVYHVPPGAAEGGRQLEALMTEADEFCRTAQLMTLARTPVMVRFARWYLGQFLEQASGRSPTRWDGPLDPG